MYNEEELLKRIDNLESRIVALECECEEYDDEETCPECNEEPCVCGDNTTDKIDDEDVDEVEELDFDISEFGSTSDDEEESPYFD